MSSRNVLQTVIGLATVALLLIGCGPKETAPAATSVAEAPATTPPSVSEAPAATTTPVPPTTMPTLGFKDPSLCPDSDAGVSVPERLPNVQWSAVDSPSDDNIRAVEALSATDGWAIGEHGSILHYDGAAWTVMSSPTSDSLRGLSMLSADEGWAVGDYPSVILHYANQRWSTVVDEPAVARLSVGRLSDVDFVASDKGWAVGPGILHYDGNNWTAFSKEELGIRGVLNGVDMVSANEGWAVGDGGTILHYQGDTWQPVDSPVETELVDVDMRSTEDGWIVGDNGTVLHFDGTAWSITATPTQAHLLAVTVDDEGEAWAVGGGGTLLRFDGQMWVKMEIPATGYLIDVATSDDGTAWAVGDDGQILRRELLDTDVPPPSPPLLRTIDNSDGDGNFSVGWESVPGNVKYVLQEADESMCPVTIYFGPETSKKVPWKDVGTYYYRVSALGVSGQSEWSEIQSIEVTVPPPPCSVECEGSPGPSLKIQLTCESGKYTQTVFSYDGWVDENKEVWGTNFGGERTYEDSGNTYEITAYAWEEYGEGAVKVRYHIEVTGGVFGETPQICGTD
jgi:photosystem II stability/assembly factor-like uncharacterized protein